MKNNLLMNDRENVQADLSKLAKISKNDIAIIGMAGRFPQAENVEQLWVNLKNGLDCISEFPEVRRNDCDRYLGFKGEKKVPYIQGAFLSEIDQFDYKFFKLSPKEASLMDPVQRLFLETVWQAVEDAGYGGRKLSGSKTGVYLGFEPSLTESYGKMIYEVERSSLQICAAGNIPAIIPSRISYLLDLKGPTISIDTACSSSLVAVHLACQGLRCGDCHMAIVGGIKIYLFPFHNPEEKLGIESSDFLTKTFDERSDGTGSGEGVASIVLKPLSEALKDQDNIYAVIKGSAINQDGCSANLTAPNALAQADVIEQAWRQAGIDPETISYIEAHGTGTKIGDPIEIDGITKAFQRYTDRKQFCGIGSIKTNIGHLYEASGIVGLIKATLALKYAELPPMIHFKIPNAKIHFEASPVYVVDQLTPWETAGYPRRCGVNAFGFSGTNCHVILEENLYERNDATSDDGTAGVFYIFTLSAKSMTALKMLIAAYDDFFAKRMDLPIQSICFITNTGRGHYSQRLAIIVQSYSQLKEKLKWLTTAKLAEKMENGIYYGDHKTVGYKGSGGQNELTEKAKRELNIRAAEKIKLCLENGRMDRTVLDELCQLYIQGADIDWNHFYQGEKIKKVSLPVYPFDHTRCWLEIPEIKARFEETGLYYTVKWRPEETKPPEGQGLFGENVILIKDSTDCKTFNEATVAFLRKKCQNLLEVEIGEEYQKITEQKFVIRNLEEDYFRLFGECKNMGFQVIIHALSLENQAEIHSLAELNGQLNRGFYSLFFLAKGLQKALIQENLKLYLISYCAIEVTGREKIIKAENAPLFGLGSILERENPEIRCKCIDIDDGFNIDTIYAELVQEFHSGFVALREGKRYVQEFSEIDLSGYPSDKPITIKDKGVYIITGGTGGLGLEVAKYLAGMNKVNLVFINRSKLPERENWPEIINHGGDPKLGKKLQAIQDIEKSGSKISCLSADISDFDAMAKLVSEIRLQYKKINGVIHAAGVSPWGFISQKSEQSTHQVIHPKVHGAWILAELTQQDDLDFLVMFSSVAATFGAPGQGDYTAANLYLDSFAAVLNKKGRKALTIDWVQWLETGMAVETKANVNTIFKALPTRVGIEALDKVLHSGLYRVLIGEMDYGSDMVLLLERLPMRLSEKLRGNLEKQKSFSGAAAKRQDHPVGEVKLKGRDNGEYTKMEKMVAQIWGEVLGYQELSIDDNFYELGGDSILAIKIGNRISKLTNKSLPISETLTMPTISDLSKYIEEIEFHQAEAALYSGFKSFSA